MRAALKTLLDAEKAVATVKRRAELRKARAGKKQAARRTTKLQAIMKILCMLSGGSTHLLMTAWVETHANHKKDWPPLPEGALMVAEVKRQVDDCTPPPEANNIIFELATAEERQIWLEAWCLYCEWECANKVVRLNMAKGVAVPGPLVYTYFQQEMTNNEFGVPPDVLKQARQYLATHEKDSTRRSWVCRWRQRWGFGVKALPSRKLECSEITRRKVIISNITRARFATRRANLFWKSSACVWGRLALPNGSAGPGAGPHALCWEIGGGAGTGLACAYFQGRQAPPKLEASLVRWCR